MFPSTIAAVPLLVGDVVRHAARVTPRALAATFGDAELTFAELDARANRTARVLAGLGVGHLDRLAWWGETSLEVMPIFAAAAKLGAAFAPVNARLGAAEAAEVVSYAKPRLLVVDEAHADLAAEWDVPTITHAELAAAVERADEADVVAPALDERDPHVIFFTSGSTGRPKGVVLSHRANWLRTFVGATTTSGRRRRPSACSRCSTWRAGRSRSARGRRAARGALRARARRRRRCSRPPRATARRASTASPRCGPASSSTASAATTSRALRRGRHRHVGDAARAPRARSRTRSRTP